MPKHPIKKIISGGQTGVDRAALDIAKELNIPYEGWCPKGRWAEDGSIPEHYLNMKETPSAEPKQRTEWNVRDSDGTLIITKTTPIVGTLYTIEMAQKHQKPYLVFNISKINKLDPIVEWITENSIANLNVAGPRASQAEEIYQLAVVVLRQVLNCKLFYQENNKP